MVDEEAKLLLETLSWTIREMGYPKGITLTSNCLIGKSDSRFPNLSKCPYFGKGKTKNSNWWLQLAEHLKQDALLTQNKSNYGTVYNLTYEGREWLKSFGQPNHRSLQFKLPRSSQLLEPKKLPKVPKVPEPVRPANDKTFNKIEKITGDLFTTLLDVRKDVAKANNKQPHEIVTEAILGKISQVRPKSLEQLSTIQGIQTHFVQNYGDAFIRAIINFQPTDVINNLKNLYQKIQKPNKMVNNQQSADKNLTKIHPPTELSLPNEKPGVQNTQLAQNPTESNIQNTQSAQKPPESNNMDPLKNTNGNDSDRDREDTYRFPLTETEKTIFNLFHKENLDLKRISQQIRATIIEVEDSLLSISEKNHFISINKMANDPDCSFITEKGTWKQMVESVVNALMSLSPLEIEVIKLWDIRKVLSGIKEYLDRPIHDLQIRFIIAEIRQRMLGWSEEHNHTTIAIDKKRKNIQNNDPEPPNKIAKIQSKPFNIYPTKEPLLTTTKLGQYMHKKIDMDPLQILNHIHTLRQQH
eukprot:TRINITY_DN6783_c0_g1_i3.p1 TRINITY_DN6783_c0_g1~~TRINITY_DN6783_c0_g1_i3.p1  ORF type:complete len:526 (+),score=125.26 TRINITY_DN6783_c0_g1_i3:210-1787(+)